MRKLAAVLVAATLMGCNDVMTPGPTVNPPSDATAAYTAYNGVVGELTGAQYVIYPEDAERTVVRLAGHEEQLSQLVGHDAYVQGIIATDGVLHVTECHCTNP